MIKRTLLIILLVLCPLALALAADWPQWHGPDRNGVSKETGLLQSWPATGPKLLWTFRDAGAGYSSMSIVGDRLYSMGAEGNKEYVYAIDLKTQKKLWSVEVGARFVDNWGDGPCSTPAIDGNFLYAIGRYDGNLVCVETVSGRKVWSQGLQTSLGGQVRGGDGYNESPLVDGDLVVATPGGKKGTIAAFDKRTGALKWRSTTLTDVACSASMIAIDVNGVRQYVQKTLSNLVGVRASDGKLLWEKRTEVLGACTPICKNNCVYHCTCSVGCRLLKLMPEGDKFKAEQVYANHEMQNYYPGVVLVGEHLYGYSTEVGWICQDFKTGKTVWEKNTGMGKGSIIFADGNLYCYHEKDGNMLLIKATSAGYQEQGKFRIPEQTKERRRNGCIYTHPVVANGKLYLRDRELIFCYDVRKPQ